MTRQERKLWYEFLKDCAQTFYRQRTIEDYIVDFCSPSKKIIIELDGSQHYEDAGMLSDRKRDSPFSHSDTLFCAIVIAI